MNLNIDKSDWIKLKLNDVCEWYQKNIQNDEQINFGIEHYVTANYIDSDSLKFYRYNELADGQKGPTITKHFEKGDLLLSTRSVALRKAALSPVEGVTGEKLLVLRIKQESALLREFMPFVFQSIDFWKYAQNSASGSVNKFTSWTKIRDYEFLLPPKDQQAQLAKLLWAMDELIEKEHSTLEKLETNLNSNIESEIHGVSLKGKAIDQVLEEFSKKGELVSLLDLGELLKGKGIPKSDVKDAGLPCVRYGELYTKHHRIIRKFNSYVSEEDKVKSLFLKKNDVLFAGSGETITEIGKSAAFVNDIDAYAGSDILVFRPFDMNGYFLGYLMNSQFVRQQLNKYGTGATVMHIYNSDLAKIKIPKMEKEKQVEIAKFLESISKNIFALESKIKSSLSLQKSLINQIF